MREEPNDLIPRGFIVPNATPGARRVVLVPLAADVFEETDGLRELESLGCP